MSDERPKRVVIVDDSPSYCDLWSNFMLERYPDVARVETYSHPYDRDILAFCLKKPYAYLGMIGSQRKVEMTKKMFAEGKISTMDELNKVDMPMGIGIGAESPDEIAISILSKLIAIKHGVTVG